MRRTFVFTTATETREIVLDVRTEQTGDEWRAKTNVTGFPGECFPDMRGADELDVVLSACRFADFQLRRLARIHGGVLTLAGNTDLALVVEPINVDDAGINRLTDEEVDAISCGLADGYTLLERLGKSGHAPREDSIEQLDALENALVRIRRGDVWSNEDVSDDDLTTLREIREMVATWNASGGVRPDGLLEKVDRLRARERARVPPSRGAR